MLVKLDSTDVPPVSTADIKIPMAILIQNGQGLAFIKGLTEAEIRELESDIWNAFADRPEIRLAVALRFRALLDGFAARRLKNLLLERGFKVIPAALSAGASQRLNTRFGFSTQRLFLAIDAATFSTHRPNIPYADIQAAA